MTTPSYVSDPQIQYLSQLLDEIADGHLLVPRFQRPVVWTDEQRLELMRSVANQTPIGSIFVWRTRNQIAYYDRLGPYLLQQTGEGEFATFLLDGHQRLSALFGALRTPRQRELTPDLRDDDPCWEIAYDLDEREFYLASDRKAGGRMVSLHVILDSIAAMRFQRELGSEPDAEELLSRLDELAVAFQRYKIPVIPIVSDDVDQVTRTFQKINSEGTAMSQIHMIHALTWGGGFDLNQRVEEIRCEHLAPYGWEEVGDQTILMTCKLTLGLDVYEGDVEEISRRLKARPDTLDDAATSLIEGIEFLKRHCNISSPRLLPYESLLPLLSYGLSMASPSAQEHLVYWFWWVTYIYFYGGSNTSRIRRAGEMIRDVAQERKECRSIMRPAAELPDHPRRFDFRHARAKALALRMAEHRQECDHSWALSSLSDHGASRISMLVPRSYLRELAGRDDRLENLVRSHANRLVASQEEVAEIWQRLKHGLLSQKDCEIHLLPTSGDESAAGLVSFLEQRRDLLLNLEHRFAVQLGIVTSEDATG